MGAALLLGSTPLWAQGRVGGQPAGPPATAEQAAPFDLTGYWTSIVTQDWIFRMTLPQRGQYLDIPISLKGREFADAWNAAADEAAGKQCEAYGAAAIMRIPGHLHITWQDENTLRVDTDAGMQTRLLLFQPTPDQKAAAPSWQGVSVAQWQLYLRGAGFGGAQRRNMHAQYGWLRISTTDMLPGLLRKNGVPYSAQTHMSENWVLNPEADGAQWLMDTTTLNDPQYLQVPYILNSIFLKQPDGSKWSPSPCSLRW